MCNIKCKYIIKKICYETRNPVELDFVLGLSNFGWLGFELYCAFEYVLNRGYVRNRDDVVLLITESPEDEKKKFTLQYKVSNNSIETLSWPGFEMIWYTRIPT